MYLKRATLEGLAERFNLSYRYVRTEVLAAGVRLRPPCIQIPDCPAGAVNAYVRGASIRQLGEKHGMSYNQMRRVLLATGLDLRPRGRS